MDEPNDDGPRWFNRIPMWIIFGGSIVLGFALRLVPETSAWHFVTEPFVHAFIVAGVLGFTVDRVAKERLLREAARDVWKHLVGRNLPKPISGFINGALDTTIVCTRCDIAYHLRAREDGRLDVHCDIAQELTNFSDADALLPVGLSVFLQYEPRYVGFSGEQEGKPRIGIEALVFDDQDGSRNAKGAPLTLKPFQAAGSSATLVWQVVMIMGRSDTDIVAFARPSVTVTLSVQKPEWIRFQFDDAIGDPGPRWQMKRVLWTGQHVRVRWFDESSTTSPTASTDT